MLCPCVTEQLLLLQQFWDAPCGVAGSCLLNAAPAAAAFLGCVSRCGGPLPAEQLFSAQGVGGLQHVNRALRCGGPLLAERLCSTEARGWGWGHGLQMCAAMHAALVRGEVV